MLPLLCVLAALAPSAPPAGDSPAAPSAAAPPAHASGGEAAAASAGDAPMPPPGASTRLRGDAGVVPTLADGMYELPALGLRIEAPLPDGYPAPTPPGMVELKTYPVVRRAEYRASGRTGVGMNLGFWPLFNHIARREIAMTSPVEMDYRTRTGADPLADVAPVGDWTMSFLYRTRDQGPTGTDGRVEVVDAPAVTVVAIGVLGPYGVDTTNRGVAELRSWFAAQRAWEPAGAPRAFHYNGPGVPASRRWSEVQIPVRRAAAAAPTMAPGAEPPASPAAAPTAPTPAVPDAAAPRPAAPATPAP